jgi:hypothetical protein
MVNTHSQMDIGEDGVPQVGQQLQAQHQAQHGNIDIHSYVNYYTNHKTNRTAEAFDEYYHANLPTFFGIWKDNVSNLVLRNLGLNVLDIPDFAYYDSFIEGIMPDQMVQYIANNLP